MTDRVKTNITLIFSLVCLQCTQAHITTYNPSSIITTPTSLAIPYHIPFYKTLFYGLLIGDILAAALL